jgi:hypothetical protein
MGKAKMHQILIKKNMRVFNNQSAFTNTALCLLIFFCTCFSHVSAQSADTVKKWHFQTDIYLLFPYMKGDIGIGNEIAAPVDATPGDIFNKLKMGGMVYLEAHNNKWAVTSDLIFMNLKQDIAPNKFWDNGTAGAKQLVWEPAGFYRLLPFIEIGVGGRLNNLQASIEGRRNAFPAGTYEVSENASKTWFDPILITRLTADIKDKWLFQFRGDIGGFGVGSDFTWQLQGYAGYRFSHLFQLTAGYRILSMDYDKGVDIDRFVYNVDTFGPVIRFGFNF